MTRLFILVLSLAFVSCKTSSTHQKTDSPMVYGEQISAENLKEHLYTLADDSFEGRMTSSEGHEKALEYIENHYKSIGVRGGMPDHTYLQTVPSSFFKRGNFDDSYNLLAFIEGSEHPEEVIVISAHSDHIGVRDDGVVYNGADDNGSGTVTLLELARVFKKAADAGNAPKRSILFLHVTGEEIGLYGSRYYADEDPVYPLENTICNLNIDMIGRIDPDKADNPEYIYLIGSDKISTELHDISEAANTKYTNIELDYTYNDEDDPNRFYYRSDHYNFAKNGIPVIFYFNGVHEDYHDVGDTPDKIEYDLLAKRAKLIFYTAWEVANKDERLSID